MAKLPWTHAHGESFAHVAFEAGRSGWQSHLISKSTWDPQGGGAQVAG